MFDVAIDGLSSHGEGIGRLPDGRVVFVPGALPGDTVRVRVGAGHKRVAHGELLELLHPSPERVASRCRVEHCGGCPLRRLSQTAQGARKHERVTETLRRVGGIEVHGLVGPLIQAGPAWQYRHRVRLKAGWVDDHLQLGYFEAKSRRLVPLIECPVLWPELDRAALEVARCLRAAPRGTGLVEVELAYSRRDGSTSALLHVAGSPEPLRPLLPALLEVVRGVDLRAPAARVLVGNTELRYDHQHAAEFDLRFEAGVFTQANPAVNDRLVDAVLATIKPSASQRVLEFHSGIGNFSLPLAKAGGRVVAVERDQRAAMFCRRNARAAGANIEVSSASDVDAFAQVGHCDVVLLDPPRVGARELCAHLASHGPARVVYVSCDPATLARDGAALARGGYHLTALDAFDMFPQTPHVETLAVFER